MGRRAWHLFPVVLALLAVVSVPASPGERGGRPPAFDHAFHLGAEAARPVIQDRQGFLWIASFGGGLFRWDGRALKNYGPRPGGLSHGTVSAVVEDPDDPEILWVSTWGGGLNRFDKISGDSACYRYAPGDPRSLPDDMIFGMIADRADPDLLWFATYGGLAKFSRSNGMFERYCPERDGLQRIVQDIRDPDVFWVAFWPGGLSRFEKSRGEYTAAWVHDPADPCSLGAKNDVVADVVQDRRHPEYLWIGTQRDGLNRFDTRTGTFRRYPRSEVLAPQVWSIFDDGRGRLWLCGCDAPSGLVVFDKGGETFEAYRHDPADPDSLSDDLVSCVFEDRAGAVWIATLSGWVDKIDPYRSNFRLYREGCGGLCGNVVPAIFEDGDGTVWAGTYGGLHRFDREHDRFVPCKLENGVAGTLAAVSVGSILEAGNGNLWIASARGPLFLWDPAEESVRARFDPPADSEIYRYTRLIADPDDPAVVWTGTESNYGLARFDTTSKTFRYFPTDRSHSGQGPSTGETQFLRHDVGDDAIWIGSEWGGGLNRFDKAREMFSYYLHDPEDPDGICSNAVVCFHQNDPDVLWVGTRGGGLEKLHIPGGRFSHFSEDEGVPPDVNKILEDEQGIFWLSTDRGIVAFDPRTEKVVRRLVAADGLQGARFFPNSGLKTRSGELWFGGYMGISRFRPDRLKSNPHPPPMAITSVTQGGRPLRFQRPEGANGTPEIVLDWQRPFFEFECAALDLTVPKKNQYRYRLRGHDSGWYEAGNRRFGRYSGLAEGRFVLEIMGSNNDGVWCETPARLRVTVRPPWWRTRAFIFSACALCLLAATGGFFWRLRSERRHASLLQKRVAEKTRDLEEARKGAEAASHAKSEFLANMSHEIRTPMNAVLGFAEILGRDLEDERHRSWLAAISSNGEALLRLIDDVLDLSRVEAGKLELRPRPVDVAALLKDVRLLMAGAAEEKELELAVQVDVLPDSLVLDSSRLRQILINLAGNAVKFTERGRVTLSASAKAAGPLSHDLLLEVADTGIGIPEKHRQAIFEVFGQVPGQDEKRYGGVGLGLSIARRLAEIMGGELRVESEEGAGSRFQLLLPGVPEGRRATAPPGIEPDRFRFRPAKVVVADDNVRNFLPRARQRGKNSPQPILEIAAQPSRDRVQPLSKRTRQDLLEEWRQANDCFFIDDIERFAARVERLGRKSRMSRLAEWGAELRRQAETIDMKRLPRTLSEFPGLIGLRVESPGDE